MTTRNRTFLALAIGFAGFTFGGLTTAHASYFVSTLPGTQITTAKRTHIVVSGKGNDLGDQPEESALVKARKIAQANPGDQVVVFNVLTSDASQRLIKQFGLNIERTESKLLDSKTMVDEMSKFEKIASFNVFGHSGVEPGVFLDGVGNNDLKWRADDVNTARLRGHFTDDAYGILNGCNGGHILAPIFSKIWGIPVAGSLTYAHFEVLFQNGNYYWDDIKYKSLFAENSLMTIRMKSDDVVYAGGYGKYPQGLPYYKFFCNDVDEGRCLSGIKTSVYSLVSVLNLTASSSKDDYMKVVAEWMCPTGETGNETQTNCMKQLQQVVSQANLALSDRQYTPFRGPSLQCSMSGCYPESCMATPAAGAACAKTSFKTSGKTTMFVDDYMLYARAFEAPAPIPATPKAN